MSKKEFRSKHIARMKALSPEQIRHGSKRTTQSVIKHPKYAKARGICLFLSMGNEYQTYDLIDDAFKCNKRVYVPAVTSYDNDISSLEMYQVFNHDDIAQLPQSRWGIREPTSIIPQNIVDKLNRSIKCDISERDLVECDRVPSEYHDNDDDDDHHNQSTSLSNVFYQNDNGEWLRPNLLWPSHLCELDLIITPCVAVDHTRSRLGYGRGYYDRYIKRIRNAREELFTSFTETSLTTVAATIDNKLDRVPQSHTHYHYHSLAYGRLSKPLDLPLPHVHLITVALHPQLETELIPTDDTDEKIDTIVVENIVIE